MTTQRRTGLALALVTACISGVAVWVNGRSVAEFASPTAYTTGKNVVAAVLLLGALAAASRARSPEGWTPPTTTRQRVGLLAVGVIGGAVPFVLFFEGLARAGSGDAAFVHKTLVVWVALLAIPFLGERIEARHVAAIALLLWGQAALGGGIFVGLDGGVLLLAAATACWSVEVVVAKRLLSDLSPLTVANARMGIGALLLLGWTAATQDPGLLPLDASQVGWLLLTGALLAGYVGCWYGALSRAPAVDVTAVLVLAALLTNLLAVTVDDVPVDGMVPGLALLVLGGAVLLLWPRPREVDAA